MAKLSLQTPFFFLEILKAVCLRFDWVQKLFQISFQTVKPKIFQRCETKVDTAACKASYIGLLKKSALKMILDLGKCSNWKCRVGRPNKHRKDGFFTSDLKMDTLNFYHTLCLMSLVFFYVFSSSCKRQGSYTPLTSHCKTLSRWLQGYA